LKSLAFLYLPQAEVRGFAMANPASELCFLRGVKNNRQNSFSINYDLLKIFLQIKSFRCEKIKVQVREERILK